MKKFRYVILLLVMACMSFAFACKDNSSQITLSGFSLSDAEKEITVNAGTAIWLDDYLADMHVTDQNGKIYEVYYDVTTADGGYINSTNAMFVASKTQGYVITYKVVASDNRVHTVTQKINVIGNIKLYAEYASKLYDVGDTIEWTPVSEYDTAQFTFSVKHEDDVAATTLNTASFVADKVGWYTVTTNATATGANDDSYTFEVYARPAFKEGEVEIFDESWATVRSLQDYGTYGWSVKTSEELGGLKDHNGKDASFLAITTSSSNYYASFWLNARAERDYYKNLVNEGYTTLSVWAYITSENPCDKSHLAFRIRGGSVPNSTTFRGIETLSSADNPFYEGEWREFKIRLVDLAYPNHGDYAGSFVQAFDYYKYEWFPMIQIETQGAGHGNFTVAISDIYACKDVDINFKDDADFKFDSGETVDFADYIDMSNLPANIEFDYLLSINGGEFERLDSSVYTLSTIGSYTLKIVSASGHCAGESQVTFVPGGVNKVGKDVVNVDITDIAEYDAYDMLSDDEKEDLEQFGTLTFELINEYGKSIDISAAGVIDIADIVPGEYVLYGKYQGTAIVWTAEIRFTRGANMVWREATADDVANGTVSLVGGWAGGFTGDGTLGVYDATTDANLTGTTGNYWRFDSTVENQVSTGLDGSWGIKVLPAYGKDYYEQFAGSSDVYLTFKYKFVKTDAGATDTAWNFQYGYSLGSANRVTVWDKTPDTWHTGQVNLTYMLNNEWADVNDALKGGSLLSINNNAYNGDTYNGAFSVYIGEFSVTGKTASYTNEYYLYNAETGEYELDETLSELAYANYGDTVNWTQKIIDGYAFVSNHEDNVLSGTLAFGADIVLKGYYMAASEETADGFQTAATFDVGAKLGQSIESYTLTQYVVKGEENVPVDVTANYADILVDGILDTSRLDGIYTITAYGASNVYKYNFEQITDSFTWNNLADSAAAQVAGRYAYETYAGNGTVSAVTDNTTLLAGYNADATYFRFDTTWSSSERWSLKIYPVHSKEYYESFLADGKDYAVAADFYFTKTGENATSSSWTMLAGQGYGYDMNIMYDLKPDSWGANTASWNARRGLKLSSIVENWSQVTALTNGGGFVGLHNPYDSESYTGAYSVYFGNVSLRTGFAEDYYLQQDDGSFKKSNGMPATVKLVDLGATATHEKKSVSGYKYLSNVDEVLTGTVGEELITLKAYYVQSGIEYTIEYWFWDGTDYVRDDELTETATGYFGETVNFNAKEFTGYIYEASNVDNVSTGVLTLESGSVVLKGYYMSVAEKAISGINTAASIDLTEDLAGKTVVSYTVSMGSVYDDGIVYGDVTELVGDVVSDAGVINTSTLDGLYAIDMVLSDGSLFRVTFEQAQEGTFTWNNNPTLSAVSLSGEHGTVYTGTATVSVADATQDTILAGKDGNYWRLDGENFGGTSGDDNKFGLRVLPGHTKEYYESFLGEGSDLQVKLDYIYTRNGMEEPEDANAQEYFQFRVGTDLGLDETDYAMPVNSWEGRSTGWLARKTLSLANLISRWTALTAAPSNLAGVMLGQRNSIGFGEYAKNGTDYEEFLNPYAGAYTVWFGNVHLVSDDMSYAVEYWLEGDDGSYAVDTGISETRVAKLGASVSIDEADAPAIAGYIYNADHAEKVLSGKVLGNNTLALKLFYDKVVTINEDGIITKASYDIGADLGESVASYTVTQFVVTSAGNKGVDVTSAYADTLNTSTGILDLTTYDGIYTVNVTGESGKLMAYSFERAVDGVFTFNNIHETGDKVVGATLTGFYNWNDPEVHPNGYYNGNLALENVEAGDAALEGKTGPFYKLTGTVAELNNKLGIKIYPAHSKEYFEAFYADGGDLNYVVDMKYVKNDTENATDTKWNFFSAYYLGHNTLNYEIIQNSFRDDKALNAYGGIPTFSLSKLVENWDNLIKEDHSGYFYGPRNVGDSAYTGTVTIYIGNVHAVDGYVVENYVQNDDGTYSLYNRSFKSAEVGAPVSYTPNAKIENADTSEVWAFNSADENNVLSGTVIANRNIPLKAYYVQADIQYTNEYYLWDSEVEDFVKDDSLTETAVGAFGQQVTFNAKAIAGYAYDENNADSIANKSATLTLTQNEVVLKGYYVLAQHEDLADEGSAFYTGSSIALADKLGSAVDTLKVEQYVVKSTGNVAVDVSNAYATALDADTGALDLSGFDGIYAITAKGTNGAIYTANFERVVVGQFTWNNIKETDTAVNVGFAGQWNESYTGSLTAAPVADGDAALDGKTGNYYSISGTVGELSNTFGAKIFPVHTKDYYSQFYAEGSDAEVIIDIKISKSTDSVWPMILNYGIGCNSNYVEASNPNGGLHELRPNAFRDDLINSYGGVFSKSLKNIVANWDNLIAANSGGYFFSPRNLTNSDSTDTAATIYFGNVRLMPLTYVNEYYLYNTESGEYEIDADLTEVATAAVGATVNYNKKAIEGYAYDITKDADAVTSAQLFANGTVVLKGYYAPASEETIAGLRNDATLDFGVGAVSTYTVTQYVVKTTAAAGANTYSPTVASETKMPVDVTAAYPDLFDENGVANTAMLDGIYSVTAYGANGIKSITFEQYKEGVFTWNNIASASADYLAVPSVSIVAPYSWQSNGKFVGNASAVTTTAATDNALASYMATNYGNTSLSDTTGLYWKVTANGFTGNDGVGLRILPAHSWNYYNTLWNGATVSFNAFIKDNGNEATKYCGGIHALNGYLGQTSSNYGTTTAFHTWKQGSFTLTESAFTQLSSTYTSGSLAATMVSVWGNSIDIGGDAIEIFLGNFTATAAAQQ